MSQKTSRDHFVKYQIINSNFKKALNSIPGEVEDLGSRGGGGRAGHETIALPGDGQVERGGLHASGDSMVC